VRLFTFLSLPVLMLAQGPVGEIRLAVKDVSGAPMEASGKLETVSTRAEVRFATDARGEHVFGGLSYGRYRLEVTKSGFAPESLLLTVDSATPLTREVTLSLGSAASSVTVIGTTPLPGTGLTRDEFPVTAQNANAQDLEHSGAIHLGDLMNRRLNGVFVNEIQGNPFQPDVNYRGYTASALLGTPQGLSVYLDGVRLNQPFGDVMSWDLIPRVAIQEITLMPGSNPLFGLNTLGGALAVETKSGRSQPGTSLQLSGGSFGRKAAEFEHGGANARGLDWYFAGNLFFEDGWRDSSPSNVRQLFSRVGWQREQTTLGASFGFANNLLNGNGLQEFRLLNRDYASVYTRPDITGNRSPLVNVTGRHNLSGKVSLFGNAYFRSIRTNTFNGDINEEALDQSLYQPGAAERAALAAAGYSGVPASGATAANTPFPRFRCIANALLRDEPSEKCNGLINRSRTEQDNYGAAGQMSWFASSNAFRNQLTAGAAWDRSSIRFGQSSELGYLNPDRTITGVAAFGDGVTGGEADGEPYDTRVDLDGRIQTGSFYATDTLTIGGVNLTASGRFNRTVIDNRDLILPSGAGSLTGRHVFTRFNPAAGATFRIAPGVIGYGSYSEGNRAPTSIELGCADPEHPCKLPNAMAGDPPLEQVITRTLEAGIRSGGAESKVNWNLGWFRANNRNDILFVASPQTGYGYFKNFGLTRRQGLEAAVSGRMRRTTLGVNYTFMNASFESQETVNGESNSRNDAEGKGLEGLIQVNPSNRIPLAPHHTVKAYATVQATSQLAFDAGMVAVSSAYARGNENNLHRPDGTYYLGEGQSPGYAVFSAGARFAVNRHFQLFVQANNLFDRKYYSAAQLGPAGFTADGIFQSRPFPAVDDDFPMQHSTFLAPGAPRAAWAGLRIRF
jgi:outer membrane receptor protein involved in Fe transport